MIANGHAKNTGHSEETSAAHDPPGSAPGCASSATHAYGSAASTAASDSAPTTRIQPIGLRGRRATISAPTAAGEQIAARRNGYSHHAGPGHALRGGDAIEHKPHDGQDEGRLTAKPQAMKRDAICTPPFSLAPAPTATVLPPKSAEARCRDASPRLRCWTQHRQPAAAECARRAHLAVGGLLVMPLTRSLPSSPPGTACGKLLERGTVDPIRRDDGDTGAGTERAAWLFARLLREEPARRESRPARFPRPPRRRPPRPARRRRREEARCLRRLARRAFRPLRASFARALLALHDLARELALQRAFGLGHEGLRFLVAPGRVFAVRFPVPGLEVDCARLLDEPALPVVDPVTGKRACSDELVVGRAVRVDSQRERRPCGRGVDPEERPAGDPSRRRESGAAAYGLNEANRVFAYLGLGLESVKPTPGTVIFFRPR